MRIGDLCLHDVATCLRSARVQELARVMRDRHVGDVVVVEPRDGEELPVGIVTDRDLVLHVMAEGADPKALTAGDIMRSSVVTALVTDGVHEAIERMARHGISRLPVVNDRRHLVGLVTASDLTRCLAQELGEVGRIAARRRELELQATPAAGPSHWRER